MDDNEFRAYMLLKPPPCGNCPEVRRCTDEELACLDFYLYSAGRRHGQGGSPSREVFEMVFPKEGTS